MHFVVGVSHANFSLGSDHQREHLDEKFVVFGGESREHSISKLRSTFPQRSYGLQPSFGERERHGAAISLGLRLVDEPPANKARHHLRERASIHTGELGQLTDAAASPLLNPV